MPPRWESVQIKDDSGKIQKAVAPLIVSASRSTDIPAFYGDWLFNRLKRGYCVWVNPFSGVPQYISLKRARFFVFWSKNPTPMLDRLSEIDAIDVGYYFQFTLNDYDAEKYEPRVPSVAARIETFKRLADRVGPSRVIWRFDPLMITDKIPLEMLLSRVERLMRILKDHTERFVFSFADIDIYKKVTNNLKRCEINVREFTSDEMYTAGKEIKDLANRYGLQEVATCAEKIDLSKYGIHHSRCIDDELIAKCRPDDSELMHYLGRRTNIPQQQSFDELLDMKPTTGKNLKDRGQRQNCGCIVSKDIGAYDTCPHMCTYCYANTSINTVMNRYNRHDPDGERI